MTVRKPVQEFVARLAAFSAPRIFNPYAEACRHDHPTSGPAAKRDRLERHLSVRKPVLLLVGEAPGYQGCRYSGVPFTSERMLIEGRAPRIARLAQRVTLLDRALSEPSATILWGALEDLGIHQDVVLFNAFPFHPHVGAPLTNRTPTTAELAEGLEFLSAFRALFPKNTPILPIGQKAASAFELLGWSIETVLRHPANGGAEKLRRGLRAEAERLGIGKGMREQLQLTT